MKAEGALPRSFVAEVAVVALAVLGIALSSAALIRLIRPARTFVPFLIFLTLCNPASALASAPELLPTPWYPLGAFLPPGALCSALRNVAYFDGTKLVFPLLVAGRLRRDRGDPQPDCLQAGRGGTLAGFTARSGRPPPPVTGASPECTRPRRDTRARPV